MIVPATPKADEISSMFAPACGDLFAGAGGWSCGAEAAFCAGGDRDRRMDLAVNHWDTAIMCHAANHPLTEHRQASVWDVDPAEVLPGRELRYLHASPDCTHFSKARGDKPARSDIRGLAWVVFEWAKARLPSVITLENVAEFETWGPLGSSGRPDPVHRGKTFREWVAAFRSLGYVVEWRVLYAHHYGAATKRKRLYIIARRDDKPIVWPAPTHGPGLLAYQSTADHIDWSEPILSIYATKDEARAWAKRHKRGVPRRPLAAPSLRRIYSGFERFVAQDAKPFMVPDQFAAAYLVHIGNGERKGQRPRCMDIREPLGTVVAGGVKHALVVAWITTYYGNTKDGNSLRDPCPTITGTDRVGLITAVLDGVKVRAIDYGARMLKPRELASIMGFPRDYVFDIDSDGRPLSQKSQVKLIGNSVCPAVAEAIVRENIVNQGVLDS